MALQTSPPISLNDIKAEFGATGSRSITEFYRGGTFVPNTPQNSKVPTSGAISLLDFLGASKAPPLSGTLSGLSGQIIDPTNPSPPGSMVVTANPRATPSGGTGSYTYQWSILSGDAVIIGSTTSQQITISADVPNHVFRIGNIRCVVKSGNETVTLEGQYSLYYSGGPPV